MPINGFIATDPPYHDEQRKAVTPVVSPANLARFEAVIREKAGEILDALPENEDFDWVEKVSIDLTNYMLATLLDFPFEERHRLTRWSDFMTGSPGDGLVESWDQKNEVIRECAEWMLALREERTKAEPRTDLISILAHSPTMQGISAEQFLGNVILLIVGGNDTTRNTMSGSIIGLNESPDEFRKLLADPGLIHSFVPEAVRWQTPILHQARRALVDTEIGGKMIREGEKVVMWYYSGNRDENVISDADRLIVDRPNPRQHLSFGFGIHRCMGNRLAELQLRVLWEELTQRLAWVETTGPAQRVASNFNRSISSLPVRIRRK
ncbi:MAG: cytochrome P450 [Sphingobium sp.]